MIEERPKPRRSSTSHTLIQRLEDVALVTGDPTVHAAVKMMVGAPEHWDDCVVYLVRLQSEAKTEMFRRLQVLVNRCGDTTVLLVPEAKMDINMSDGQVVAAGEWPATERTVVELSRVVYFRDFLRSFWRRLTKR
jgi:hypothetical protein